MRAQDVKRRPTRTWVPERARTLPDCWFWVDKHRPAGMPIPTAMFIVLFFEETACCNVVQGGTPYAIGPGQMQASDYGPTLFFAGLSEDGQPRDNSLGERWDSSMTVWATNWATGKRLYRHKRKYPRLPELTQKYVLADFGRAVKLHVKMLQWEWRGQRTGDGKPRKEKNLDSLLGMQLGGQENQASIRRVLKQAAGDLNRLVLHKPPSGSHWTETQYEQQRRLFADVLSGARSSIKGGGDGVPYDKFEDFWRYFLPDGFIEHPMGYIRCGF